MKWLLAILLILISPSPVNDTKFYGQLNQVGVEKWLVQNSPKNFDFSVSGAIIPHHLTAGYIGADIFRSVSEQKIDRIVYIAPNHYEKGEWFAISSFGRWQTPYGLVDTDKNLVAQMVVNKLVKIDEKVQTDDHAISGVIPLGAMFLPKSKIVPILLSAKTSDAQLEKLADFLSSVTDEKTLFICAVDFSHGLNSSEAERNDQKTLDYLNNPAFIKNLGNEFLDSPNSVNLFNKIMSLKKTTNMEVVHHTNSGKLINQFFSPVTSYFGIIYSSKKFEVKKTVDSKIVLVATGDVIPARMVNAKTLERNNFNWPWEKTADFLRTADITIINLESPLLYECPIITTGFKFCGDYRHAMGMQFAGIDIANLVNNHVGNFGKSKVEETKKILSSQEINSYSDNEIYYQTIKNTKFAFLGFNDVGYFVKDSDLDLITQAKKESDIVVVSVHWGAEYRDKPDNRQVELAHKIIDRGADLIIGNHPHWIQPAEVYKDKLIVYAHGNFIFDQEWSEKTKLGVIGEYTFEDKKLINHKFYPIKIYDYGQPRFQ